jgi:hypothetical protein
VNMNTISKQFVIIHMFFEVSLPFVSAREREERRIGNDMVLLVSI